MKKLLHFLSRLTLPTQKSIPRTKKRREDLVGAFGNSVYSQQVSSQYCCDIRFDRFSLSLHLIEYFEKRIAVSTRHREMSTGD